MAEHMGSYKDAPEIFEDKDHYTRNKLLLWSLFVQDRLLSLSTGRLCTVRQLGCCEEAKLTRCRSEMIWSSFRYQQTKT